MRISLSLLFLSLSLFGMRSHATEPKSLPVQTPMKASMKTPMKASNAMHASRVAAAPAGKAQVVFFRDSRIFAFAAFYTVHDGDHSLARLYNGQYFVSLVEPGAHRFEVHTTSKKSDVLDLTVEAGKTYYVMSSVTFGMPVARPHLATSDEASFLKMAAHLEEVAAK